MLRERTFVPTKFRNRSLLNPGEGRFESEQAGDVVVSALVLIGESRRLEVVFAIRAGAPLANALKLFFNTRRHIQNSGSERAQQPLMTGSGQQVDRRARNIDRQVPSGLCGIDEKERPCRAGHLAHGIDRLDRSRYVRRVDERDQPRVVAERALHLVGIDASVAVAWNVRHFHAAIAQVPQRPQHRVVFDGRRDDVIARSQEAVQRQVQTVRPVKRENDLLGLLCPEQPCRALTAAGDDFVHSQGRARGAASLGGAFVAQRAFDGLRHPGRFRIARRGVVEIDALHGELAGLRHEWNDESRMTKECSNDSSPNESIFR